MKREELQVQYNQSDAAKYTPPSMLTIETAEELAAQLKLLPRQPGVNLEIDLSNIEGVTTPGLQLFVSMQKALQGNGAHLNFSGKIGDVFSNALTDTGLDRHLTI